MRKINRKHKQVQVVPDSGIKPELLCILDVLSFAHNISQFNGKEQYRLTVKSKITFIVKRFTALKSRKKHHGLKSVLQTLQSS